MTRLIATLACVSLAGAGCAGTFGGGGDPIGRTSRISDSSRVTASSIVPNDAQHRGVIEHLALAEEIYAKTLDALRERRSSLRSRRRALTVATYATFAATTLAIGAAAIAKSTEDGEMGISDPSLRLAGFGALGGLGVGTTLEVVNLMQEDPSNVEAKMKHLQSSYDNMVERLRVVFVEASAANASQQELDVKTGPIIEQFINEALQINIKG